jgi:hypothetical protein
MGRATGAKADSSLVTRHSSLPQVSGRERLLLPVTGRALKLPVEILVHGWRFFNGFDFLCCEDVGISLNFHDIPSKAHLATFSRS